MKKVVGIIITVSMIIGSTTMAWADIANNGGTETKDVKGSYAVSNIKDVNGDGVPDTDTKDNNTGEFTADGADPDNIPDGDNIADTKPDYDVNNDNIPDKVPAQDNTIDWDGDGDVDEDDKNFDPEDSPNIDAPDAISPEGALYSVTITWGNLLYDYSVSGATWDPETHTYINGSTDWVGKDGDASKTITVANNSNVDVRVRYKFERDAKFPNLKGTFAPNVLKLQNALGKPQGTSDSKTTMLDIDGDPGSVSLDDAQLGTVTIKIDYTII